MWHARREAREWARRWLLDEALPLWWRAGADHARGGFYDKLDWRGQPLDLPKTLRVQVRQIVVFCAGGRWGWQGPWQGAVEQNLHRVITRHKRPDGLYRALPAPAQESVDLDDQAFMLSALAAAYRSLGSPAYLMHEAQALLDALERELAHPAAGYEEAKPPRLPLRAAPHMHMLEATLAWVSLGERHGFETKAGEMVALALVRLIDPMTGAIGAFFNEDWLPALPPEGLLREPGQQFGWAYLLHEGSRLLEIDTESSVDRLRHFGNRYGMRDGRVMMSVDEDGEPVDRSCRLWGQTERLRAMLALGLDGAAAESFAAVQRFLKEAPMRGLWRERADANGQWIEEPSPASSLYDIVAGFEPLIEGADREPILFRNGAGHGDGIW